MVVSLNAKLKLIILQKFIINFALWSLGLDQAGNLNYILYHGKSDGQLQAVV